MQVRLQLLQFEPLIHGYRISDHMQVVVLEIYESIAGFVLEERIGNGPLLRDGPVKTLGSRRNGSQDEWGDFPLENFESFSHSSSGDTARQRP